MTKLQYQVQSDEEAASSISIDMLLAHGVSADDVQKLKQAGVNTCNNLLKLTNKDLCSTGVAKVQRICEAAQNLVCQGLTTASDVMPNIKLLCDEAIVKNLLEKPKRDIAIKILQKRSGGKQVQLAVTECTVASLLKENIVLKDSNSFLNESCAHDPPIGTLECLSESGKAPKTAIATGSREMLSQLIFSARTVDLYYAENLNNIRKCDGVPDEIDTSSEEVSDDSSSEEEVPSKEQQQKKRLKRSE